MMAAPGSWRREMAVLQSRIDTKTEDYAANRARMLALIAGTREFQFG